MATISFTTKFNFASSPKVITLVDTSNYAGQGITLSYVNGVFNIIPPSGIPYYTNTDYSNSGCDIKVSTSTTNQLVITLPVDGNGQIESGNWTLIYSVYNSNTLETYTVTDTVYYAYEAPEGCITDNVDCLNQILTATDATQYIINGVTPVLSSYELSIYYPVGSALYGTPTVSTSSPVQTTTFYNGTQSFTLSNTATYTFEDGLIVSYPISAQLEEVVNCTDMCSIYCCVRTLKETLADVMVSNPVKYKSETMPLFSEVMGLVGFAKFAVACNKSADVSSTMTLIKTLTHCTDDCRCDDGTPTQVFGIGALVNSVVVTSGGTPVIVTPNTVGSTTTYTVSLSSAFVAKVAALHNTIIAAGSNVTVTSATGGDGTVTYTVNATVPTFVTILSNNTTPASTSSGSMALLMSYNIPAGTMASNGDMIDVIAVIDTSGTTQRKAAQVRLGGTVAHTKVTVFNMAAGEKYMVINLRMTRQGDTTLFLEYDIDRSSALYQSTGGYKFFETGFSVLALSANALLVEVRGQNISSAPTETIIEDQLVVKYFKK